MIAATQSNHPLSGLTGAAAPSPLAVACARLRETGMRVTKPRVAIIEALLRHETPVAIEQLHQEINATSCDLVTVYRCLGAFEEIGLVRRSFHHNGTSLFELVRPGRSRSYHIQCKACGKVEPVDYFPVDGMERILTERGYTQLSHLVEFFGICPACQPAHSAASRQVAVKPAKI